MNLYLAGVHAEINRANKGGQFSQKINILESFLYVKQWMDVYIEKHWDFMLDSGAFSFISGKSISAVDINSYVDKYADYIKERKIELFFELDIDKIVGLDNVEKLRRRLESRVGKQCIPVFHRERGKDYFDGMCRDYKYIAIGGIVSKNISRAEHKYFHYFINRAHHYGAKIHGLGYTSFDGLKEYAFDSVDSTGWLRGNLSGFVYVFNIKTGNMEKHFIKPGQKLNSKAVAAHNFAEWVKFQKYMKGFKHVHDKKAF